MTFLLSRSLFHILLIVVLGIIAYSNTFSVPFYFDDTPNIVENQRLRDLSNFWPPSGSRWFGFLTFAINYRFGGLYTSGYHAVNLAIHILNAILVYFLVALTFKTPYFGESQFGESVNRKTHSPIHPFTHSPSFIALLSALLFVVHPIQTQAVTYIVQRFTSLAAFFYLLSLVMYIKFRLWVIGHRLSVMGYRSEVKSPPHHLLPVTYYLLSIFSAILAMKTKEIAFTLPMMLVLYELMFFKGSFKKRALYLLPILVTSLLVPLSMLEINKPISEIVNDVPRVARVEMDGISISRSDYLFTQFRVVVTYIRLLFFPANQTLDYDYPIYDSFFNPNVYLSFLFLLGIFVFAVYLFYASRVTYRSIFDITPPSPPLNFPHSGGFAEEKRGVQKRLKDGMGGFDAHSPIHLRLRRITYFRLISFGIFWFFTAVLVESSIIPIVHVIFEHRVYLPSIGIIIAFSSAVFYVFQFTPPQADHRFMVRQFGKLTAHHDTSVTLSHEPVEWSKGHRFTSARLRRGGSPIHRFLPTVYCLLSTVLLLLLITTYMRNELWGNPILFWRDNIKKAPKRVAPYYYLGAAFYESGRLREAVEAFNFASIMGPEFPEIFFRKGLTYERMGWWDDAIREYEKALSLRPDYREVRYNLIAVQTAKKVMRGH